MNLTGGGLEKRAAVCCEWLRGVCGEDGGRSASAKPPSGPHLYQGSGPPRPPPQTLHTQVHSLPPSPQTWPESLPSQDPSLPLTPSSQPQSCISTGLKLLQAHHLPLSSFSTHFLNKWPCICWQHFLTAYSFPNPHDLASAGKCSFLSGHQWLLPAYRTRLLPYPQTSYALPHLQATAHVVPSAWNFFCTFAIGQRWTPVVSYFSGPPHCAHL